MNTPTTVQAIEAVRACFVGLSGLADSRVVLAYTAQVPRLAVGHIHLTPIARGASDHPIRVGSEVRQLRSVEIQIDALGADACEALEQAHTLWWARDSAHVQALLTAGVGTTRITGLEDTTTIDRTAYAPRLTCRVTVSRVAAVADAPPQAATAIVLDLHGREALTVDLVAVATIPIP